ncbi:hypothetical protein SNE40_018601 [Patella caerulea]|uniref:Aminotransferase class V domain-containing protein n=1 Tax=Patella caerulea TaxID=87958 RepID=A0AAN8J591_PATCE
MDKQAHKRDFGSFHSSNVQELLALSEDEYRPPKCPFDLPNFDGLSNIVFDQNIKEKYFMLEDKCVFLNHGAFGGVLKPAQEVAQKWQIQAERQPLRFYDRELLPLLADVTRRLAKFVDCDPTDLVLINNATTAINTVIRSSSIKAGDVILILSITYGAVKKLLKQIVLETGAVLKEIEVTFPVTGEQQLIDLVEKEIVDDKIKLAIFDHIPSNTPIILPVQELIKLCHSRNIKVLIDGAHALGSLSLNLKSLNADFYVSNAHKWFCCPKGAAFLYVKPVHQTSTRPLVISHGFGSGFNSEFIWSGLHDYSSYLALPTVIEFWEKVGFEKVLKHNQDLAKKAGRLLCKAWGTELMAPEEMFGAMTLVKLPWKINKSKNLTYTDGEAIQNTLYTDYDIEVPMKCIGGAICVRISAHIYNTIDEYQILATAILEICEKHYS